MINHQGFFFRKKLLLFIQKTFLLFILLPLCSLSSYALSPYSTQELDELEKQFMQLINQSDRIERNPLAVQYLNHLGKQLAHQAHLSTPYFFIVKSNEINAFAGPGGYIGINTQLILATENESELAAVMAHELAHVRLHHLYRLIEHEKQMRVPRLASLLASLALGVINPTLGGGAMMASMSGFAQDNINFTRANEKEADRIGINILINTGLDPRGMAGFFKKMQQNMRYYYTANIPAILRTHPLDEDRIAEAENRSMGIKNKNYPDHLDYYLFKEIVRNGVNGDKELLDYYQHQCQQQKNQSACQYGQVIAFIHGNQFKQAELRLQPLLNQAHDNLFYQIAMAEAETGMHHYEDAIQRLKNLQSNYPENYAVLMAYSQALITAGENSSAINILLKGFRQFKGDLALCEILAQAQSAANQKGYAYFTQSQCYLLQGRHRDALRQLKQAKTFTKQNHYLQARINALIEEIKYMTEL